MRHPGEVRDYRMAADILAQGDGQGRRHVGISLRTENFRQPHHLPLGIGHFQAHAGLAGNGFDHAYAHHRQRSRQIFHQIENLVAFHAYSGLDFIAGNDRARDTPPPL